VDTPLSVARKRIDEVVQECRRIQELLDKSYQSRSEIGFLESLATVAWKDRKRDIKAMGSALKAQSRVEENLTAGAINGLFFTLRDIIEGIPTGKKKSELKVGRKRLFLKKLGDASRKVRVRTRLQTLMTVAMDVSTELASLEILYKPKTQLIPSGRPLKGRLEIEEILTHGLEKELLVCDPYFSCETLGILEATPKDIPIKILTARIDDIGRFRDYLSRLRTSGYMIDVLLMKEGVRKTPHDRFLISGNKGWIIGTSIKDIGKRDSTIGEIDNTFEVKRMIDEYCMGKRGPIQRL